MTANVAGLRAWLLAGTMAGMFAAAWPAAAQQAPSSTAPATAAPAAPASAPTQAAKPPPPSWMQGAPTTADTSHLAPNVASPLPTPAAKLPVALFKVPKNFHVEVFASGMPNARSLRVGDKGTVFVSTRVLGRVYAITDKNGKHEVKTLWSDLHWPNGIVLHNGTLYIADQSKILKADNIEAQLDNPPKPTVIYSDLPSYDPHGWKFLTIGPDNRLYFNVGAPCNICMPPDGTAQLRSINLDGSDPQVVARGIRQVVGLDFNPVSKVLYFTENQRDWLSEDEPNDKLNRLLHPGKDNFGYPYCDGGDIPDTIYGWGHSCNDFTKPIAQLGAHAAPLGLRFYTGRMFPKEYHDALFIALHGSWNKTKKNGGMVVVARLNGDGSVRSITPFMTGFLQDNKYIARPVDIEWLKDGSMLVSDDWNGAVYRVSYGGPHQTA
ncbi:MAG TPA: PQQ-dependent sugar dehydrogenase, partial [Stellaceae bacterium]